jgi:hypothetical protein
MKNQHPALIGFIVLSLLYNGQNTPNKTTGVVLGDSLVVSVSDKLRLSTPDLVIDARNSRTLRQSVLADNGFDRLTTLAKTRQKRWVVELGTNDAWTESIPIEAAIRDVKAFAVRLARILPPSSCVVWILPHIGSPAAPEIRRRARTLSQTIQFEVLKRKCWSNVDWPLIAMKNPELVHRDGVHLSERGKVRFSSIILDALNRTPLQATKQ